MVSIAISQNEEEKNESKIEFYLPIHAGIASQQYPKKKQS